MKQNVQPSENNQKCPKSKLPKAFIILRVIAFIVVAVGIALLITSFVINEGDMFDNAGIRFGGVAGIMIGAVLTFVSFTPSIQKLQIKTNRYIMDQNEEDLKYISSKSGDISSSAVEKVAKAAKEGFHNDAKIFCKHCGKEIDADSKFCSACGKKQSNKQEMKEEK